MRPRSRAAQPGLRAFPDQGALELGDGAEDLQGEAALRAGGVDRVAERAEPRPPGIERLDDLEQVGERAGQPVDADHDQDSPRPQRSRARFSSGRARSPPDPCSRMNGRAAGRLQGVDLRIGRLLVGGDAGVADQRHDVPRDRACAGLFYQIRSR